jgi:AraC family transcriptional regulator
MSAHPTLDGCTRISVQKTDASECLMCRGTGRVLTSATAGATRSGFPKYLMRRIEELVDTRLDERGSVTDLASTVGYSPSHFFRMFRRSFGVTPHAYVMRRRLAVAQYLLTRTDLCLADVALKAGFSDQSHLSRTFRRFAGIPPRAFRALNHFHGNDSIASTA